ncbi:MAG TPA: glycosyltransferase family 87 protein [Bacteroidales bacterium]|nr:glycosyltransferase family 87 protein [Bacteroidales bacterium]
MSNAQMMNVFIIAAAFIITYALYIYSNYKTAGQLLRLIYHGIFAFSVLLFVFMFFRAVEPKDWDYTCFYLIGKVAQSGLNIYNPDHYYVVLADANIPIELGAGFKTEFLVTGSLYPPPTTFLFLPLGYMTYMQGLYFFYGLILLAFIGCIYQVKKIFFQNTDFKGWELVAILLMLTGTFYSVINYAQTLIFLLFFFLLIYGNKEKPMAGVYLAISIFIKPFAVVFFFYFLIKKKWSVIASFIASTAVLLILSLVVFGYQPFYEYIFNNPSHRVPDVVFNEVTNQSLLAILTRVLNNAPVTRIVYYLLSFVMVLISGIMILRLNKDKKYDLIFPLLLSVGLLIYPNTLYHYAVVHILSFLIICKYIQNTRLLYAFTFCFFISLWGRIFYVNLFLFAVMALLAFEERIKPAILTNRLLKPLAS